MIFATFEFRNAPETKVPGAAEDLITVLNAIANNVTIKNADTSKLCIGGSNGGALICLSASILMAQRGIDAGVKAQFLWCPMINRTISDIDKEKLPDWEKPFHGCGKKFFDLMSDDGAEK